MSCRGKQRLQSAGIQKTECRYSTEYRWGRRRDLYGRQGPGHSGSYIPSVQTWTDLDGILHVICPAKQKTLSKNTLPNTLSKNYLQIENRAAAMSIAIIVLREDTHRLPTGSPRSMRRLSCVSALRAPPARHPCMWASSTGKLHAYLPYLPSARWSAGLAASAWLSLECPRACSESLQQSSDMVSGHDLAHLRSCGG